MLIRLQNAWRVFERLVFLELGGGAFLLGSDHFESLDITLIKAPFSSLSLWLSALS